jgi:hypothetical protein
MKTQCKLGTWDSAYQSQQQNETNRKEVEVTNVTVSIGIQEECD